MGYEQLDQAPACAQLITLRTVDRNGWPADLHQSSSWLCRTLLPSPFWGYDIAPR